MILGDQLRTAESENAQRVHQIAAQVLRRVQTLQILAEDDDGDAQGRRVKQGC